MGWAGVRRGFVLLTIALVGAGCSAGSDEPPPATVAPPPSASPSSSPSPSTSVPAGLPELPEAATKKTPDGAKAFVRFYIDVANASVTRPESGLLLELGDKGCQSCVDMDSEAVDLVRTKTRYENDPLWLDDIRYLGRVDEGWYRLSGELHQKRTNVLDADDTVARVVPANAAVRMIGLTWRDGRWLMYDMG